MDDNHPIIDVNQLAGIIRTVHHHERLQIIQTLHQNPNLTISQISSRLNIHRSIISQHCKSLKEFNIIKPHSVDYPNRLVNNYPKLQHIVKVLDTFSEM